MVKRVQMPHGYKGATKSRYQTNTNFSVPILYRTMLLFISSWLYVAQAKMVAGSMIGKTQTKGGMDMSATLTSIVQTIRVNRFQTSHRLTAYNLFSS